MSKKPNRHSPVILLLSLLIVVMIAATAFVIWLCIDMAGATPAKPAPNSPSVVHPSEAPITVPSQTEAPPTTAPPEPESVVSTAVISVQGDLLMHTPVFDTCIQDGKYNFESIFRYVRSTITGEKPVQ